MQLQEIWDEELTTNVNKIENWRQEKTVVGPEPLLIPVNGETSAEASMYADDNSAGEKGKTVKEVKEKTEKMLQSIFDHMRSKRLLVNSDKTKVMLLATYQKRTLNDLEFHVDVEGLKIKEVKSAKLLGVFLDNNFSWDNQINETIKECSKRIGSLYIIQNELTLPQRKTIVEGSIISLL